MITTFAVLLRIFSNSTANLYQKKSAELSSPILVNLYSYLLMSLFCIIPALFINWNIYPPIFWVYVVFAGLLCTIGTIALIAALKIGDLSVLAPINSYKSVIGLISAIFILKEFPNTTEILCILLIIIGSYFVIDSKEEKFTIKTFLRKDIQLRFFALFCSGIEASFLKKIILMSSFSISLILWCFSGFICSFFIYLMLKPCNLKLKKENHKNCFIIAITLIIMQLSTNYVFSKIPVGTALALFQLSSLVSLYYGYKMYHEKHIIQKFIGTIIMISSAAILLLKH